MIFANTMFSSFMGVQVFIAALKRIIGQGAARNRIQVSGTPVQYDIHYTHLFNGHVGMSSSVVTFMR